MPVREELVTPCGIRAEKYADKIGAVLGLDSTGRARLRDAYMKSCGKWAPKYEAGMRKYAGL